MLHHHIEKSGAGFLFLFFLLFRRQRLRLIGFGFFIYADALLVIDIQKYIDSGCNRAGIVQCVCKRGHLFCRLHALFAGRFCNFISDGI